MILISAVPFELNSLIASIEFALFNLVSLFNKWHQPKQKMFIHRSLNPNNRTNILDLSGKRIRNTVFNQDSTNNTNNYRIQSLGGPQKPVNIANTVYGINSHNRMGTVTIETSKPANAALANSVIFDGGSNQMDTFKVVHHGTMSANGENDTGMRREGHQVRAVYLLTIQTF